MGSLTTQEKKEPEELVAVGEEPGHYFGEIPCFGSRGQKVLMPEIQVSLSSHGTDSKVLAPAPEC